MEKIQNIYYIGQSKNKKHQLDIYSPEGKGPFPVLIFTHGGSWYNGCKEIYQPLGINLANKGIMAVVINYRLGGEVMVDKMAEDVAAAVRWTYNNIENYKGSKERIFIMGHSAGGHLSALISLNEQYLSQPNKYLKGCILIDAFGLNMDYVMHNNTSFFVKELERVFGKNPQKWREAAPVHYVQKSNIPFLIQVGKATYPYLTFDNEIFRMNLEEHKVPYNYKIIPSRDHIQMITALENENDSIYTDLFDFISLKNVMQHPN